MKISDAILAIKEFFLEVLGFLLPGFTLLILIYLFLKPEYQMTINSFLEKESSSWIIIVVSYLSGYFLYGIGAIKETDEPKRLINLLKFVRFIHPGQLDQEIEKEFKKKLTYHECKKIIKQIFGFSEERIENMRMKEMRSIAMSYIPEADKKIYNFMFRADLSEKVVYALKIMTFLGILSYFLICIPHFNPVFKTTKVTWAYYLMLLIPTYFLRKTQRRFYGIALRLVFPIFIAKMNPVSEQSE